MPGLLLVQLPAGLCFNASSKSRSSPDSDSVEAGIALILHAAGIVISNSVPGGFREGICLRSILVALSPSALPSASAYYQTRKGLVRTVEDAERNAGLMLTDAIESRTASTELDDLSLLAMQRSPSYSLNSTLSFTVSDSIAIARGWMASGSTRQALELL